MTIQCPSCESHKIKELNHGQKTLSAIGILIGAAAGMRATIYGSEIGMKLGKLVGRPRGRISILIGSIYGAFLSGRYGCSLGAEVGKKIDLNILDNHKCLNCGYTFSTGKNTADSGKIASC